MKASDTIKREIRAAYAKDTLSFYRRCRECAYGLSTPDIMDHFPDRAKRYQRAALACVLACAVMVRAEQGEHKYDEWARDVLKAFPTWDYHQYDIVDNLHPSRLIAYAGKWIDLNSED